MLNLNWSLPKVIRQQANLGFLYKKNDLARAKSLYNGISKENQPRKTVDDSPIPEVKFCKGKFSVYGNNAHD